MTWWWRNACVRVTGSCEYGEVLLVVSVVTKEDIKIIGRYCGPGGGVVVVV